jgi:hypothetical protein
MSTSIYDNFETPTLLRKYSSSEKARCSISARAGSSPLIILFPFTFLFIFFKAPLEQLFLHLH